MLPRDAARMQRAVILQQRLSMKIRREAMMSMMSIRSALLALIAIVEEDAHVCFAIRHILQSRLHDFAFSLLLPA